MVQCARVQPQSPGSVTPDFVDSPLQEPLAQALADEFGQQTELDQFDLAGLSPDQFAKSCRVTIHMQHMQFVQRVLNDDGEFRVGKFPATESVVFPSHRVVKTAVAGNLRRRNGADRQPLPGNGHGPA